MTKTEKDRSGGVKFYTSVGGQALMEGIMMKGPARQAIVCSTPDGYVTKVEEIHPLKDRYPVLGWPVIRGAVAFITSMITGVKAMMFSASCLPEEEQEEPGRFEQWISRHFDDRQTEKLLIGASVFLGVVLAVGLFFLLPTVLTGLLGDVIGSRLLKNLIEGLIRIAIFLGYLALTTRVKEIARVWQYHGAEHKTIYCYEKELELTVDNCRVQSRLHPRCGTSFLFLTMIISILVFGLVSWKNVWIRLVLRLALLPVVFGLSYELIKFAGRHDNLLTRIISAPGKALQRLTTKEPDDDMILVAIEALKMVIPEKKEEALW